MVIRYDLIGSYLAGVNMHPQEFMKMKGYTVLKFEGAPIGDCVFMDVTPTIGLDLYPFITKSNWKFTLSHPTNGTSTI